MVHAMAEMLAKLPAASMRRLHHLNRRWALQQQSRRREGSPIQSVVLLLRRPQYPINQHLNKTNEDPPPDVDDVGCERGATADDVLRLMDALRIPVKEDIYLSLVKECTHTKDALQAAKVHAHIIQNHHPPLFLANRLLAMYSACGQLDSARHLFEQIPIRGAVSWATMIAAVVSDGAHREAMELFADGWLATQPTSCLFNEVIAVILVSSIKTGELGFGQQVHGFVLKISQLMASRALVQFYTMLGHHRSAHKVFDQIR